MPDRYQYEDTRALVALVNDAAELVRSKGEAAFDDFRVAGSRWRQGETYVFVLDPGGKMLLHPDPALEGRNVLDMKDINGKPIIRGLLSAVTSMADKTDGWYHYQWPVRGGLLPRWKSSYVQLVKAPSGKSYVVGWGVYNDRMEREFVVSAVQDAVGQIEKNKEEAFRLLRDPTSPFIAKDAYIFVIDEKGTDLVNLLLASRGEYQKTINVVFESALRISGAHRTCLIIMNKKSAILKGKLQLLPFKDDSVLGA